MKLNDDIISDNEFQKYLTADSTFGPVDDILVFWMKQQRSCPALASIAADIYSIPALNTTVERLFYSAANTITDRRTTLNPEKVNELLFSKKNLLLLKECHHQQSPRPQTKKKLDKILALSSST